MTTTDDRPAITCPSWCHQGSADYPCTGEHYSEASSVAATAGRPVSIDAMHGALFPVIDVAVVYSQHPQDGDAAPFVSLSSTESGADLDLRLPEARELIRLLQEAVDLIG